MATASVVFKGATFTFATTPSFSAQITGVDGVGYTSEAVDATHSLSPDDTKEFIASGLVGHSPISFDILFDPTYDPNALVNQTKELVITWSNAKVWTGDAICTGYTGGGTMGDYIKGKLSFQPVEKFTITG